MWWVSSLLSLVTTPKPHHSEPLICIHGWLTAGAPFPLECSTWGEVHEHTSHISAPGWIQRWVEKGPVWIQPFPSNLHFDGNPFFIRQVMWNVLESTWLRFYRAVRIWTWSICAIFYLFFLPRLTLKYGCDTDISQKYTITICSDSIRVNHSPHSHPTESRKRSCSGLKPQTRQMFRGLEFHRHKHIWKFGGLLLNIQWFPTNMLKCSHLLSRLLT